MAEGIKPLSSTFISDFFMSRSGSEAGSQEKLALFQVICQNSDATTFICDQTQLKLGE
jgi:hypothetical protein